MSQTVFARNNKVEEKAEATESSKMYKSFRDESIIQSRASQRSVTSLIRIYLRENNINKDAATKSFENKDITASIKSIIK